MRHHTKMLREAINFAASRHEGQLREDGSPYFDHLLYVCNRVPELGKKFGIDQDLIKEAQVTAMLHDIIEEEKATYSELLERFPFFIARNVKDLSRDPENETYEEYIARVLQNIVACLVKLPDMEHNIITIDGTNISEARKKKRVAKYQYHYQIIVERLEALQHAGRG